MTQKIKEQWAVLLLLFIVPVLHIWIGTENSYIADSALKAMQTDSLIQSGFRTEELRYPAQELDPYHEAFFLPGTGFAKEIRGKFIGQYPIAFSFVSSLFRLAGITWKWMPMLLSFFTVLSLYLLSKRKLISQRTVLLGYGATIIFALSLDFSEYSIYFLFNSLGFSWWLRHRELKKSRYLYFALIACSIPIWLRLESLLFLGSLVLSEILILGRNTRHLIKELNPFAVLFSLSPMFPFFLWNFWNYGHILGVRFIFNYGNDNVAFFDRILRFISITFVNYVDGIPKFGLFFCSSFLLLPVLYYVFFKNERNEKINFLLMVIGLNTVLVGILAPNDGITITGRYLILTIIPLLILWENWKPHASKIWKILSVTLIVFSFLISGLILKILQHSTKQERIYRDFYARSETSLWIFTDPILCGQAGSDHLSKKILCFNSETNLDRILKNLESIPSLTVFEMNEKEFRNLENKIPMILSSESRTILKEKLNLRFQKEKNPPIYKGVVATRYNRSF
ncbi:LA_3751/LA_3752 family putative glycosyltransferase [Leptospira mayottensis]|nr:hypothetical protein [Leptospira mayottensis]AXR62380.1 hypothetical protein DQM68_06840 [Leptospira mayottensis]AXR66095.1 hypothetical protein DQM28_08555 [Leptospira mayottensis]AZQ03122.1 hypothetical protein LEP1GSC190_14845 [Leptospira mayottensis 200901116]TGN09185.1 hypothetical protein EHR03_08100 [Leptospira mayottensis]